MSDITTLLIEHLKSIDWSGPALFVVFVLAVLLLLRKWSMLLLILLTITLAWGAQDLIITNLESSNKVVSVPFIIYCVGGGIIIILSLLSFFKSSYK